MSFTQHPPFFEAILLSQSLLWTSTFKEQQQGCYCLPKYSQVEKGEKGLEAFTKRPKRPKKYFYLNYTNCTPPFD